MLYKSQMCVINDGEDFELFVRVRTDYLLIVRY